MEQNGDVLLLGCLAHLKANPFEVGGALEIIENGALYVDRDGAIQACGQRQQLIQEFSHIPIRDFGAAWILPGFVDGHIHFPQMEVVAAEAGTLMNWLTEKIYPAEAALADPSLAQRVAVRFVRRLLASGTTTAMVFGSQFLEANRRLFTAGENAGINLLAGMTMMDCGGPESICHTPQQAYEQVITLASEVEKRSGLTYVITPRFALATSPAMLEMCQSLVSTLPNCPIQTHINESPEEIEAVRRAFPQAKDYLDVYERAGLIQRRTVLAHNIHATDDELRRLAATGAAVCHCPNSNLFLGSGLFPLKRHLDAKIPVLMGTDIGAGLRFCLMEELNEAYKVQKLQGFYLNAGQMLYLVTLGAILALGQTQKRGNFEVGKRADLVIVQPARDPDLAQRLKRAHDPEAALFALIMMGGPNLVEETHVGGRICYRNGATGF